MIEFRPDRYFVGMWYFSIPAALSTFQKGGNMLTTVWRPLDGPDDVWTLQYRFRYYKDERIWDHADDCRWYQGQLQGTEEVVQSKVDLLHRVVGGSLAKTVDFFPIRGNGERAVELFRSKPPSWMHGQSTITA